jgi:uncharacterized protein (DUF1778 family)
MPQAAQRKNHPLSMRLQAADIAIIDRAAALRGRSRTEFVRDAAVGAAEQVILEGALVRLSPKAFKAFTAALAGPAKAVPAMVEVLRRKPPWETGGRTD